MIIITLMFCIYLQQQQQQHPANPPEEMPEKVKIAQFQQ